ncbi:MobH family relaxase [Massilia sp. YMA4]|uniref:MobH family relaxase n=1 Tax=[Empedobacter] haloabium TaxID=592317 RepID=A0ABZ1US37_9BURK|nr:MobH family relaxase [Massilia sp. YMA4]AXA91322.1 hypothetical protein DPH57_09255 [Massilia sp. YMA4]
MAFIFKRGVARADDETSGKRMPQPSEAAAGENMAAGVPFAPIKASKLIEANGEALRRLKLCYGREDGQFESEIMTVIARYANYVNGLPATADNYFSWPGGLFRLGLECAFFALQSTDAQIFEGRASITKRRGLEPRWRLAALIAGLCIELQPLLNIAKVTAQDGSCWQPCSLPLSDWLERYPGGHCHIVWSERPRLDGIQNFYALPLIVPATAIEYLGADNSVVIPAMLAALARLPLPGCPDTLTTLVRKAAACAISKDIRRLSAARGGTAIGENVARLLIDCMHDLVHSSATWLPNSGKSRVWHAQDGTFVAWPGAAHDLSAYADRERLYGMPRDPDEMLAALDKQHWLVQNEAGCIWHIEPPGCSGPIESIKLAAPEFVLVNQLVTCSVLSPIALSTLDEAPHAQCSIEECPQAPQENAPSTAPSQRSKGLSAFSGQLAERMPDRHSCMRLPAAVASVIRSALRNLATGSAAGGAHALDIGILIPLPLFRSAKVDVRFAARCLAEVGMLVPGEGDAPVHTRVLEGAELQGLVLKTDAVTGLGPLDTAGGGSDAGAQT